MSSLQVERTRCGDAEAFQMKLIQEVLGGAFDVRNGIHPDPVAGEKVSREGWMLGHLSRLMITRYICLSSGLDANPERPCRVATPFRIFKEEGIQTHTSYF